MATQRVLTYEVPDGDIINWHGSYPSDNRPTHIRVKVSDLVVRTIPLYSEIAEIIESENKKAKNRKRARARARAKQREKAKKNDK